MVKHIAHKICCHAQVHNVKPVQKKLFACQSWCLKQFIDVNARMGNGLQQSEMVQRIKCLAAFIVSNFNWFAQAANGSILVCLAIQEIGKLLLS